MATKKEDIKLDIPLEGVKAKLQTARVMLLGEDLKKSGKNNYAGFDFFQLDDFIPSIIKIFTKLGLYSEFNIVPQVIDYEEKTIVHNESKEVTKIPIIKEIAMLEIYDLAKPGDTVMYEMEVAPVMIGNNTKQNMYQAAGGRNTYYKRYLYMNALEITENDESDTVLGKEGVHYQQPQPVQFMPQPPQMTPYNFMPQQPVQVQPNPQIVQPTNEQVSTQVNAQVASNVERAIEQEVTSTTPLSTESKMEIMQLTNSKNLNGAEIIGKFCKDNNLNNTNELLECHKQPLIDMINNYGK